jgi:Tfp pilus assembly protein PilF
MMKHIRNFSGCLLLYMFVPQPYAAPPPAEQAMYGDADRAAKLKDSDKAFIASLEKAGRTREAVAKDVLREAWVLYQKVEYGPAMRRFNQAWLLDPENGDAYHGFAVITLVRDKQVSEAERLFRLALSKPGVNANAYVDYGRFLWIGDRLDESLAQLHKALELSPRAHNARSNIALVYYKRRDFTQACEFARAANANGDDLQPGFLAEMCGKGATG